MKILKEYESLNEDYIGKAGIEKVKKNLHKLVDEYIKIIDVQSEIADEAFFVKDFANWYKENK